MVLKSKGKKGIKKESLQKKGRGRWGGGSRVSQPAPRPSPNRLLLHPPPPTEKGRGQATSRLGIGRDSRRLPPLGGSSQRHLTSAGRTWAPRGSCFFLFFLHRFHLCCLFFVWLVPFKENQSVKGLLEWLAGHHLVFARPPKTRIFSRTVEIGNVRVAGTWWPSLIERASFSLSLSLSPVAGIRSSRTRSLDQDANRGA